MTLGQIIALISLSIKMGKVLLPPDLILLKHFRVWHSTFSVVMNLSPPPHLFGDVGGFTPTSWFLYNRYSVRSRSFLIIIMILILMPHSWHVLCVLPWPHSNWQDKPGGTPIVQVAVCTVVCLWSYVQQVAETVPCFKLHVSLPESRKWRFEDEECSLCFQLSLIELFLTVSSGQSCMSMCGWGLWIWLFWFQKSCLCMASLWSQC